MTESLPSFEAKQLKLDHFKQQHSESFVIFWCGPQNSPTPCLHRILFEETSYSLGLMRGICPSPKGFVSLENFGPEAGSSVRCLCNLDGSGRSPVAHCCIKNEIGTAGLTCPSCGCCPWIWSSVRILARSILPPTTTSSWCCHISKSCSESNYCPAVSALPCFQSKCICPFADTQKSTSPFGNQEFCWIWFDVEPSDYLQRTSIEIDLRLTLKHSILAISSISSSVSGLSFISASSWYLYSEHTQLTAMVLKIRKSNEDVSCEDVSLRHAADGDG